jgi:uncharacterized membrane protein HdeD (DUF308 family)
MTTTTNVPEAERAARTISPTDTLIENAMPYQWRWWAVVLRGIAAIVFGVLSVYSPTAAFASIVVLFGIYAIVDGILVFGMGLREQRYHRGSLIVRGLVSIAAGILVLVWPAISSVALLVVIAAWAIASGVLEIAMSFRRSVSREWLLLVEGVLSIVFGVLLLLAPLAGAIVLGLWVGAFALVYGGMLVQAGFRLRSIAHAHAH